MKEFAKNSTKGVEELNTAENKDIEGIILPLGKNGANGSGIKIWTPTDMNCGMNSDPRFGGS
jgi:hypothetical protein